MLELSAAARVRLECLLHFVTHGQNVSVTARRFGIARSTMYKWLERADLSDSSSFEEQSRAPRRVPQPETDEATIALICGYRTREPLLSKETISERLKNEHGITLSASTVGRVIRRHGFYFADTPAHRAKRSEGKANGGYKAAALAVAVTGASLTFLPAKAHALEGSSYEIVPTLDPIGGTLEGTDFSIDGGTISDLSFTTTGGTYQTTPAGTASSSASSLASAPSSSQTSSSGQAGGGRRTIPIPDTWKGHFAAPSSSAASSLSSAVPPSFPSLPTTP